MSWLKRMESTWSRIERENINENWSAIERFIGTLRTQLNNIVASAGKDNSENVAARTNTVAHKTYTTVGERLDTEYAQKADKDDLDAKFEAVGDGSPVETFSTYDELVTRYPSGAKGIYLVTADGHWYYWHKVSGKWEDGGVYQAQKIKDESVSYLSLSKELKDLIENAYDLERTRNLYNPELAVFSRYINDTSGKDEYTPLTTHYTGKIECTSGKRYTIKNDAGKFFGNLNFFNANGERVQLSDVTAGKTIASFVVPDNVTHFAVNIRWGEAVELTDFKNAMKRFAVYEGLVPDYVTPYNQEVVIATYPNFRYADHAKKINKILTRPDVNLYDPAIGRYGYYVNDTSGKEEYVTIPTFHTGWIKVEPNTTYTMQSFSDKKFGNFNLFDADKVRIALKTDSANKDRFTFTTTENTAYMTVNVRFVNEISEEEFRALLSLITLYKAPYYYNYRAFGDDTQMAELANLDMLPAIIETLTQESKPLKGKTVAVLGDSNSELNYHATKKWVDVLSEKTDATIANYAKSGFGYIRYDAPTAKIYNQIDNVNGSPDIIVLLAGGNDVAGIANGAIPLGDIASNEDFTTFYGALKLTYRKLAEKFMGANVLIAGQARRAANDDIVSKMSKAQKEVAEFYGFPFLDLMHSSGITPQMMSNITTDGVHYNDAGQAKLANKIIPFILTSAASGD